MGTSIAEKIMGWLCARGIHYYYRRRLMGLWHVYFNECQWCGKKRE